MDALRSTVRNRERAGTQREPADGRIRLNSSTTINQNSMSTIIDIRAREILDSRGNPTIEADVTLDSLAQRPRRGSERSVHRRA